MKTNFLLKLISCLPKSNFLLQIISWKVISWNQCFEKKIYLYCNSKHYIVMIMKLRGCKLFLSTYFGRSSEIRSWFESGSILIAIRIFRSWLQSGSMESYGRSSEIFGILGVPNVKWCLRSEIHPPSDCAPSQFS